MKTLTYFTIIAILSYGAASFANGFKSQVDALAKQHQSAIDAQLSELDQ